MNKAFCLRAGTLLLIVLVFYSCKDHHPNTSKKVFYYNESNGISSLDPALARGMTNIWGVNQLFNGLLQMDDNLNILPCIARRWEMQDSGKKYIFYLRRDVYFHKNALFGKNQTRPVVARDIEFSFKRLIDPGTASTGSWIFSGVKGVKEGKPAFTALNDTTFIIELERPFPAFKSLLCNMYCSVVPREVVEYYGKDFREHPVGTGPFVFSRWKEGERLIFLKNPEYFEKDSTGIRLPYLDAISISFLSDKQSEFMEFIQGRLDFLNTLDASYKDELLTHSGKLNPKYQDKFRMVTRPFLNTEYLGILMNGEVLRDSPLKLRKVRQALAYGFNRNQMMAFLRNGIGSPGVSGIIPVGLPPYGKLMNDGYSYDPQKAKALLSEAGFPYGKGLPEIVLYTTPPYSDLCEYLQGQWTELGIRTRVEINQGATHREMVSKQKFAFFRGSWLADYPDAESYLSLFYSKNRAPAGPNTTQYNNPAYDILYEKALSEINIEKREALYKRMNEVLLADCPFIVLYYDVVLHLYQHSISGIQPNPMNWLSLKRAKKA